MVEIFLYLCYNLFKDNGLCFCRGENMFLFELIKFLLWDWWTDILLDIAAILRGEHKD